MHIADVKITSTWTPLSKFTVVEGEAQYIIINNSQDDIYAVEGDDLPDSTVVGAIIVPGNYIVYKKGVQAELYMKSSAIPVISDGTETQSKVSNITINKVG